MRFNKTLAGLGASFLVALSLADERAATAGPPVTAPTTPAPAAPPAPAPAVAAPAPLIPLPMDGSTYTVRLRDIAERIDDLKEKIRRHHTRIALLGDSILDGTGGAGARATIKFSNEMGHAFRVTRVMVALDGAVQYARADPTGTATDPFEIPVYDGLVPAGDHTLQVVVNLQGDDRVFSYLRGYRFEVRSSHSFTAIEGRTIKLDAVSYEKGPVTTPFEDRPALRYAEKIVSGIEGTTAPAPGPKAGAPPR